MCGRPSPSSTRATQERLADALETRGADPQQQPMRRAFLAGRHPAGQRVRPQGLVYVLNKNNVALATVSGFTLGKTGLTPIAGSTRVLNPGATDAAQVKFSPDGRVLVVTGRSSQRIDTFTVQPGGLLGPVQSYGVAPGATP